MNKPNIDQYLYLEDYLAASMHYRQYQKDGRVLKVLTVVVILFVVVAGVYARLHY